MRKTETLKGDKKILGHSAIQALCRIIGNLYTLRGDARSISINVGGISGGTGKGNVVADTAGLIAEVRFYEPDMAPMQQTDAFIRQGSARSVTALLWLPRTHGGGSDGSFAASAGIPVVDGMGAEGEFSHTMEEYVKADTIMQRLQTCIDLIGALMHE